MAGVGGNGLAGALPAIEAVAAGQARAALAELAAARQSVYYDAEADAKVQTVYYEGVVADVGPRELFAVLSHLVATTHHTRLPYKPHVHLYPAVDLQADGGLLSIYTGEKFSPERLIAEDAEVEASRMQRRRSLGPLAPEAETALESELEAELPFNCEHTVPQSWFKKREPMRGDLHHLFTCQTECNGFRGNTPYFEFADFEGATQDIVRQRCGKQDGNRFEPHQGKGPVARATLYFLLRYPGEIDRAEFEEARLATILDWHRQFGVTEYERHRNAAIQLKQGNRNPFVDEPTWADAAAIALGLGP